MSPASLARRVELGRKLIWDEVSGIVEAESPFVLLCVFPVAIVNDLFAFGVNLNGAIRVALRVERLTLGCSGWTEQLEPPASRSQIEATEQLIARWELLPVRSQLERLLPQRAAQRIQRQPLRLPKRQT
jgi:hypothetical protein